MWCSTGQVRSRMTLASLKNNPCDDGGTRYRRPSVRLAVLVANLDGFRFERPDDMSSKSHRSITPFEELCGLAARDGGAGGRSGERSGNGDGAVCIVLALFAVRAELDSNCVPVPLSTICGLDLFFGAGVFFFGREELADIPIIWSNMSSNRSRGASSRSSSSWSWSAFPRSSLFGPVSCAKSNADGSSGFSEQKKYDDRVSLLVLDER